MAGGQQQVQGARELEQSAHAAADSLGDMASAHSKAGAYITQVARSRAPVASGRLAGSIRAEHSATEVTVTAGGPGVPYAGPIHWGWPARNISAQPFLVDAMEATETSVVNIYGDDIERTVATIHGK
jgi:HK97 gp10 family phage protein